MPETTPEPMTLADVPVELVDLFDEGSFAAAKADTSTSPITAEQAYIRGGLAAVIPVVRAAERAKVAEEIEAACPFSGTEHSGDHCDYEHAARIARGEQP